MPATSLLSRAKIFIEPADAAAGQRQLERVLERDADGALAAVLAERPPARKLLLGVFGCSPISPISRRAIRRAWRACCSSRPRPCVAPADRRSASRRVGRRSRADARSAPRQAGGGAGHRARRSLEGLGHDDRRRGRSPASPTRRCAPPSPSRCARRAIAGKLELVRSARARARLGLDFSRHGQAGRL